MGLCFGHHKVMIPVRLRRVCVRTAKDPASVVGLHRLQRQKYMLSASFTSICDAREIGDFFWKSTKSRRNVKSFFVFRVRKSYGAINIAGPILRWQTRRRKF